MQRTITNLYEHEKCSACKFRDKTQLQTPCNMCGKDKGYKFFKEINKKQYAN